MCTRSQSISSNDTDLVLPKYPAGDKAVDVAYVIDIGMKLKLAANI